jgi:hypothetical protein
VIHADTFFVDDSEGCRMYEAIKPPTDNLYKFLALSGLIVFLFFGWAHLKDDLAILKHRIEIAQMVERLVKIRHDYALPVAKAIDKEIEEGKIKWDAKAHARIRKVLIEDKLPEEDRLRDEFFELALKGRKLVHNDDPERVAILVGAATGFVFMVIGFSLWYRRVQRPLDEIMRYDLEERRQQVNANNAAT